ncbi:MAG: hypothetical protein ACI9K3_000550, partial [Halovenus sp.]
MKLSHPCDNLMTDDETVGWKETLAELDRLGTEYR